MTPTQVPTRPPPVNGTSATEPTATATGPGRAGQSAGSDRPFVRYIWALTRLSLGWVFMWAFLDKMFGLGHETASGADAYINGGSPTAGFLGGSVGPFSGIYHSIAGAGSVDFLFMAGLLGIGAALLLGIFMKPACIAGATMVILMWSAALPPENNLFMDDHIIYALVLIGLAAVGAGKTLGLGNLWARTGLVKRFGWLA
jgi:thiosulfate dehydrogenase [quinone] large subunit